MKTLTALCLGAALVMAACSASGATTTPLPSSPPSATPGAGSVIELTRVPEGFACDAIGVEYRSVTFRIDPKADEVVTATTDTGDVLATSWSPEFQLSNDGAPAVVDRTKTMVAADGTRLSVGERLNGRFVCFGPEALAVLAADPL